MKISKVRTGKAPTVSRGKKAERGRGTEFADQLRKTADVEESAAVTGPGAANPVDGVLAVQETSGTGDEQSRRRARNYADDILDRLEQIRQNLLLGAIPKDDLADLARRMRAQRRRSDDPNLNEILDEIELRAEVEIAKFTRSV